MRDTDSLLPSIEIETASPADKSVIWLHGLGAHGSDFVPFVSELHLPSTLRVRFVFPHAPVMPVTINNGYEMAAWHDIYSFDFTQIDHTGIKRSVDAVQKLIQREIDRGVSPEKIILGGFSQGSAIALVAGLSLPYSLAGIIALSGYFPGRDATLNLINRTLTKTPIFMAHGTLDMVVPHFIGDMSRAMLNELKMAVEWHTYSIAHSVCQEEIDDISRWMQKVWNGGA